MEQFQRYVVRSKLNINKSDLAPAQSLSQVAVTLLQPRLFLSAQLHCLHCAHPVCHASVPGRRAPFERSCCTQTSLEMPCDYCTSCFSLTAIWTCSIICGQDVDQVIVPQLVTPGGQRISVSGSVLHAFLEAGWVGRAKDQKPLDSTCRLYRVINITQYQEVLNSD